MPIRGPKKIQVLSSLILKSSTFLQQIPERSWLGSNRGGHQRRRTRHQFLHLTHEVLVPHEPVRRKRVLFFPAPVLPKSRTLLHRLLARSPLRRLLLQHAGRRPAWHCGRGHPRATGPEARRHHRHWNSSACVRRRRPPPVRSEGVKTCLPALGSDKWRG